MLWWLFDLQHHLSATPCYTECVQTLRGTWTPSERQGVALFALRQVTLPRKASSGRTRRCWASVHPRVEGLRAPARGSGLGVRRRPTNAPGCCCKVQGVAVRHAPRTREAGQHCTCNLR